MNDMIICIGRQYGSGGREVGEKLAKRLGVTGVWCAWPIGWTIAMVLSVLFYRRGPWEKA